MQWGRAQILQDVLGQVDSKHPVEIPTLHVRTIIENASRRAKLKTSHSLAKKLSSAVGMMMLHFNLWVHGSESYENLGCKALLDETVGLFD